MENLPLYHKAVKVPVEFKEFEEPAGIFEERRCDISKVNKEFTEWLASLNAEIAVCLFFCSPPNKKYSLHVDGNYKQGEKYNCAKINIVFDSSDTVMHWYQALPGFEDGETFNNTIGRPVKYWNKKNCKVLHTTSANQSCLIDGSVIHDLENGPNNGRFRKCYSLILKDKTSGEWLSWNDVVQRFKPFFHEL